MNIGYILAYIEDKIHIANFKYLTLTRLVNDIKFINDLVQRDLPQKYRAEE